MYELKSTESEKLRSITDHRFLPEQRSLQLDDFRDIVRVTRFILSIRMRTQRGFLLSPEGSKQLVAEYTAAREANHLVHFCE